MYKGCKVQLNGDGLGIASGHVFKTGTKSVQVAIAQGRVLFCMFCTHHNPVVTVVRCKFCLQMTLHAAATATPPGKFYSSYRCAVTQHQCTYGTGQGKHSLSTVQCCSAKQADTMLVPLQLHLWSFCLHTGVK